MWLSTVCLEGRGESNCLWALPAIITKTTFVSLPLLFIRSLISTCLEGCVDTTEREVPSGTMWSALWIPKVCCCQRPNRTTWRQRSDTRRCCSGSVGGSRRRSGWSSSDLFDLLSPPVSSSFVSSPFPSSLLSRFLLSSPVVSSPHSFSLLLSSLFLNSPKPFPSASQLGKYVEAVTLIYDCEGLGLKHIWKPAIEAYGEVCQLLITVFHPSTNNFIKNYSMGLYWHWYINTCSSKIIIINVDFELNLIITLFLSCRSSPCLRKIIQRGWKECFLSKVLQQMFVLFIWLDSRFCLWSLALIYNYFLIFCLCCSS